MKKEEEGERERESPGLPIPSHLFWVSFFPLGSLYNLPSGLHSLHSIVYRVHRVYSEYREHMAVVSVVSGLDFCFSLAVLHVGCRYEIGYRPHTTSTISKES